MSDTPGVDSGRGELRRRVDRFVSDHFALVLIVPALLVLVVLFAYPAGWVLYRSLWLPPLYPEQGHRFAPYGNYQRVITSPAFYESVLRTLVYTVGSLSLSFTAGLTVALAIDHVDNRRLRYVYTTVIMLALAIPASILALTWRWILHPSNVGLANRLLMDLSIIQTPIPFLESEALALPIVTLIDAWVRMPLAMVVFLAGLQSIPNQVYEAAKVDGATTFQTFRHITLPYLRPYAVTVGLLVWMFAFQAFTVIWNMTGGGPNRQTRTIALYIYDVGILWFDFGYGSAISAFLVAIAVILTALYVHSVERPSDRR